MNRKDLHAMMKPPKVSSDTDERIAALEADNAKLRAELANKRRVLLTDDECVATKEEITECARLRTELAALKVAPSDAEVQAWHRDYAEKTEASPRFAGMGHWRHIGERAIALMRRARSAPAASVVVPEDVRKWAEQVAGGEWWKEGLPSARFILSLPAALRPAAMHRAIRDIVLESTEPELREAMGNSAFNALSQHGKDLVAKALAEAPTPAPDAESHQLRDSFTAAMTSLKRHVDRMGESPSGEICVQFNYASHDAMIEVQSALHWLGKLARKAGGAS